MQTYKVELYEHNPEWAEMAEVEAARLRPVWGKHLLAIHHAGSTSIPGIKAKPIIDFCVEVDDTRYVDEREEAMIALGYEPLKEFGVAGRRFFRRVVDGLRTHNVHVFPAGHPEIARMLDFRDYLRAHPADALAYQRLKEDLAARYTYNVETYAKSKSEFVEDILRKAAALRRGESELPG